MNRLLTILVLLTALSATQVAATGPDVNFLGEWRCVSGRCGDTLNKPCWISRDSATGLLEFTNGRNHSTLADADSRRADVVHLRFKKGQWEPAMSAILEHDNRIKFDEGSVWVRGHLDSGGGGDSQSPDDDEPHCNHPDC